MTQVELTNVLIGVIIALITFVSNRLIKKIDSFEKSIQNILMSDLENKKDIVNIKEDVVKHEVRINKLEKVA